MFIMDVPTLIKRLTFYGNFGLSNRLFQVENKVKSFESIYGMQKSNIVLLTEPIVKVCIF